MGLIAIIMLSSVHITTNSAVNKSLLQHLNNSVNQTGATGWEAWTLPTSVLCRIQPPLIVPLFAQNLDNLLDLLFQVASWVPRVRLLLPSCLRKRAGAQIPTSRRDQPPRGRTNMATKASNNIQQPLEIFLNWKRLVTHKSASDGFRSVLSRLCSERFKFCSVLTS